MTGFHLAQRNIGRLRYEVGDPRMAEFIDNLAFVNDLAERSPGFVWRYQDDSGSAIETRPLARPPHGDQPVGMGQRRGARAVCLADGAMAAAMSGSSEW